jgi:hypothetical protein
MNASEATIACPTIPTIGRSRKEDRHEETNKFIAYSMFYLSFSG